MNTIWIVMPILIVLMFLLGIDLDRTAFAGVRRQPKAVLLGMLGQLVLLPIIAFGVAWALNLPPVYFMGLMLVACCPGGCVADECDTAYLCLLYKEKNRNEYGKERWYKETFRQDCSRL